MTLLDQGLGSHADAPYKREKEHPIRSVGAEVLRWPPHARRGTATTLRQPRCIGGFKRQRVKFEFVQMSLPENGAMKRLNGIPADGALGQADEFPISSSSIRSSLAPVDISARTRSSAIPPRICQISASVITLARPSRTMIRRGPSSGEFPARRPFLHAIGRGGVGRWVANS